MIVQTRFNDVSQRCQIAAPMTELNALGTGCSPTGICQRKCGLFIGSLTLESFPALRACIDVVPKAFQNNLIKRTRQLTLGCISVGIYDNRDVGVLGSIVLQKWNIFLVNDDHFGVAMIKYISNVFLFQTIIDGCRYISLIDISPQKTIRLPMLTAPAAAIPKIDSRNAGVFGQSMPTLPNPCFLR